MSDIPYARRLLQRALKDHDWLLAAVVPSLMYRKKPKFIAKARFPRLTAGQKQQARAMRKAGWGVNEIAVKLKTGVGRVSEACANVRRKR